MGAREAVVIAPQQVVTATWVRLRCQFGCSEYGQCATCPPHSPTPETTRKMLDEYRTAILLHASATEPLRKIARELERTIFLAGYYKAFAFLCGPCWLCKTCAALGRKGAQAGGVQASGPGPAGDGGGWDRRFRHGPGGRLAHRGRPHGRVSAGLLFVDSGRITRQDFLQEDGHATVELA